VADRSHGKRKNPAGQRLGFLAVPAMDFAAIVLVEKDAGPVGVFVQNPSATQTHVGGDAEFLRPMLSINPVAFFIKQMPHQRTTTVTT